MDIDTKIDLENFDAEIIAENSSQFINPAKRGMQKNIDSDRYQATWKVKDLTNKHRQIIRLMFVGLSSKEISERTGFGIDYITRLKSSPIVQEKINELNYIADSNAVDVRKEMEAIKPHAFENISEAITKGSVKGVELTASQILKESNNLLDRTEGKPSQTQEHQHQHVHLNADDIEEFKRMAEKIRKKQQHG